MKWPLYFLSATAIAAAGGIALNNGWNLPPPAADTRQAPAMTRTQAEGENLPSCCAKGKPSEGESLPECCAKPKHAQK